MRVNGEKVKVKKWLKKTKLNTIWRKKKKRLENWWSELEMFKKIALKMACNGYVKAKDLIRIDWVIQNTTKLIKLEDLKPCNFSHIIAKSKNEELRLDENNIEIVSFRYHYYYEFGSYLDVNYNN